MYFLVDFENVRSNGLRGADYLDKNDYLTLFFSSAAHSCENRYLEEIDSLAVCLIPVNWLKQERMGWISISLPGLVSFMEPDMMTEWLLSVKIRDFMQFVITGI